MDTLMPETTRVFQCASCGEYINTSMSACKFCGNLVDGKRAEQAAELQAAIGNACSDASFLRITAGAILVAFAARC